jgi:hypothetical protein
VKKEETSYWKRYSWLNGGIGYSVALGLLLITAAQANLDEQVSRVSNLVFGKFATITVGGALIAGGSKSILDGQMGRAAFQFGAAICIGIAIFLAKNGHFFSGLS